MSSQKAISESELFEGLSVIHLKFYGIWDAVNHYRAKGYRSFKYNLNAGLGFFSAIPYVFFQFMCVFFVNINLQVIIFVYLTIVPIFQVSVKISAFWYRIKDQSTMFDLIKEDFLTCIPEEKKSYAKYVYKKIARRYNIFSLMIFFIHSVTIFTWMVTPGIDVGNGRKKILGGWYPFPYWESPWFEIVFIYELVLLGWHGSMVSVYECEALQLLMGLQAHFKVLNHHIATLVKRPLGTKEEERNFLNEELAKALLDHKKLLSYSDTLKDMFNFLITMVLSSGIVVLVVATMHLIFEARDPLFIFKLLIFLSYEALEITLICFNSSFLETASSDIQFAAYSSDWHDADLKYRHTMHMMMLRANRPVTLVALKMYPVNLEILIKIYQFIYTVCTLLSGMKE